MHRTATAALAILAILSSSPAFAGPSTDGVYKSTDLGGPVDLDRYTERIDYFPPSFPPACASPSSGGYIAFHQSGSSLSQRSNHATIALLHTTRFS